MTHELAAGNVTLCFTDVEGSTELLARVGAERYADIIDEHRLIVRRAVAQHGGREIDSRGEEFFTVFARSLDAVEAAVAIERDHEAAPWEGDAKVRVRIGMHTGAPVEHEGGYLGLDVHRAARICSAGHGGQVLISRETAEHLTGGWPDGASTRSLGTYQLKGIGEAEEILQLVVPGLQESFPALRVEGAGAGQFAAEEGDSLAEAARRAISTHRQRRLRPSLHRHGDDPVATVAWEVRARLGHAPTADRERLAELATELFNAARVSADADRFVSEVDRKHLDSRLRGYREMAAVSKRAEEEANSLEARGDLVRTVELQQAALGELAVRIEAPLERIPPDAAAGLREQAAELAKSLESARGAITRHDLKLARTRHRGIYRRGAVYVVRETDEVGIEHDREFESLHHALAHRKGGDQAAAAKKTRLEGAPHDYGPAMQRYMPVRDDRP